MSEQSTEQQPDETASTQAEGTTVNVTGSEPDVNVHGSGPTSADTSDGAASDGDDSAKDEGSAE